MSSETVPGVEPLESGLRKNEAEVTVVFRIKSKPTAPCCPEVTVTVSSAEPDEKTITVPPWASARKTDHAGATNKKTNKNPRSWRRCMGRPQGLVNHDLLCRFRLDEPSFWP